MGQRCSVADADPHGTIRSPDPDLASECGADPATLIQCCGSVKKKCGCGFMPLLNYDEQSNGIRNGSYSGPGLGLSMKVKNGTKFSLDCPFKVNQLNVKIFNFLSYNIDDRISI
jgi:hypothetical protein